jgi:hypothetical protein
MSNPYGRPYRRRKATALRGQPPCSICGKPILRPEDGTLHHDPPVADGGNAFHERPAHKTCNASHGGRLGARARVREPIDELEYELDRPLPKPRTRGRSSSYPKYWPGAVDVPIDGPAEVIKGDGVVIRVERGQRYVP